LYKNAFALYEIVKPANKMIAYSTTELVHAFSSNLFFRN